MKFLKKLYLPLFRTDEWQKASTQTIVLKPFRQLFEQILYRRQGETPIR